MTLQLEAFFEVALDLLCIRSPDGRLLKVNPAWEACLGYRREELEGLALLSLIHPDDVAATKGQMEEVDASHGATAHNFVNRYRHKDGSYRYLEWQACAIDGLVYGAARDVSGRIANEQKQKELNEELKSERDRLARVQAVAKIGSWETDLTTLDVRWSDETYRIFEKDQATFSPRHGDFLDIVHPDDRDSVASAFDRSLHSPDAFSIQHRILLPDGRIKEVEERWQALADSSGAASRVIGTCQDVSERHQELKAGHAAIDAALAATQAVLDNSFDVICTIGHDGRIVQINWRAAEILAYDQAELEGAKFLSVVHPEDHHATIAKAGQLRRGAIERGSFTNRCVSKTGEAIPMMWSATWSAAHKLIFAVARDLREQIAGEERLRQAQKMEAIGRLTGGVAHDFNNLLTLIIGSAQALAEGVADRPDLRAQAQLVLGAADRGAELIARLLSFARNQPLLAQPLDCNAILDNVREMVRHTFAEDIEVVLEPTPADLSCLADRAQLTTALLNLCINARDAMPDGGKLTLRAAAAGPAPLKANPGSAPSSVCFSVEDTGCGMSVDIRRRATEPFFTTKGLGEGSGLGLSMVDGFANQSGGELQIHSEVGQGTRVELILPATRLRTRPATAVQEASKNRVAGRILVVEDDDLLRSQVERQLLALGHTVTVASDGPNAMRVLSANPEFDLLMTDVVMPNGMNGWELADRAREVVPHIRILLTSGHNEDALLRGRIGHSGDDFLGKPYRRAELDSKVSTLLQQLTRPGEAAHGGEA